MKEWGYPEYDPKFDDPAYLREQFKKEREDPRENPNFFLDTKDPMFWDNAARKPYAKALLDSEEHWKSRKDIWLQQNETVQDNNREREEVCMKLENCEAETKRIIAPIMKHRIVDVWLIQLNRQAKEDNTPFETLIERVENRETLKNFRQTIDFEGDEGAEYLFKAWDSRNTRLCMD